MQSIVRSLIRHQLTFCTRTRRKIHLDASKWPLGHQRDRSKASIRTVQSNLSEERRSLRLASAILTGETPETVQYRPSSAPTEPERRRVKMDKLNMDKQVFAKPSGYPNEAEDEAGLSATFQPGELHMPVQIPSRENSNRTQMTIGSSNEPDCLAAEYQAQCVAIHTLRSESTVNSPEDTVVKFSVLSPSESSLLEAVRVKVPVASKLERHFDIDVAKRSESHPEPVPAPSPTQLQSTHNRIQIRNLSSSKDPDPTPKQTPADAPSPPPKDAPAVLAIHPAHRAITARPVSPVSDGATSCGYLTPPPFNRALRSVKSKEEIGMNSRVPPRKCKNAVIAPHRNGNTDGCAKRGSNLLLRPAEIQTTIEAPGGRRVSSTFRTSWP